MSNTDTRRQTSLARLPLYLVLVYLAATIAVFFFGPILWPTHDQLPLITYLALALLGVVAGYLTGLSGQPAGSEFAHWRTVLLIGVVASIAVLFPSAYVYTGKMPWQIFDALQDQKGAYENMLVRLTESESIDRGPLVLARTLSYPFVFALVPLTVLHWRRLSSRLRIACVLGALSSAAFSILRGTDREFFDLLLATSIALLVLFARDRAKGRASVLTLSGWVRLLFIALLAAATVIWVFVERRAERIGGVDRACIIGDICADYEHPLLAPLDDRLRFGASMLASYASQGYFGLYLALQKDFDSTWGIGHSTPFARLYTLMTGDSRLYERSYTFRLRDDNWSDEHQWSTLFTWLANDVGFAGALVVVAGLSWLFAHAWKDAVFREDDRAAIIFSLLAVVYLYLPANNQVGQTFDAYFAAVAWTVVWLRSRGVAGDS